MSAPVCLIVNPSAGGGKAGRLARTVERALAGHGLSVRRVDTRDIEHARDLGLEAARAGETVVALSGDGMIGVLADALRTVPGAVLGLLPGGRGNDLARILGISEDAVQACATIANGVVRPVDLGEASYAAGEQGQAYVGIASVGFDSDANRIANEAPSWLGGLVYTYGALRALLAWRPARFTVQLDPPEGERHEFTGYSVGVANSKAYGGGMIAAPDALLDDGLLEVLTVEHVGRLRFLTVLLPNVFRGTHVKLPYVHVYRAESVEISSDRQFTMYADGDPIGSLPLRLRALPAAVNMIVPPEPAARPVFSRSSPIRRLLRAGLMSDTLAPKLALARAAGALSRLRGGGATSVPGKVLMRLAPGAIGSLGARLTRGSALISATNGKTTTAAMAAAVLRRGGVALVHNEAGANMAGGIASTLLAAARPHAKIDGDLGLFEVDEMWLAALAEQLHPRSILLGNLFRDQLDRYGELEAIAERWKQALARSDAQLVLNADDPLVADLGREHDQAVYFGVEDASLALDAMSHAVDARHCRRCGAPYVFDAVYLGHLGHYHCERCGQRRPVPSVRATDVTLEGVRAARFTLHTPAGSGEVRLALPGLYNVYNALAAAALASTLGATLADIVVGLGEARPAFGRAESVLVRSRAAANGAPAAPRELRMLLVKNPAGANEVLRTLALEPGQHDLLGVLNDNIADGRDVSWIWDADFELLAGRIRRVTCSGTRAAELALRFKYAGVDPGRINVEENLEAALDRAAGERPDGDAPLYALPTYTAMLALRALLVARGEARSAWA